MMNFLIPATAVAAIWGATPAIAQTVPSIDTEDATLGSADVGSPGRVHPMLAFDLRNGDFARGDYDDDRADLGRLPIHAQVGVAIDLGRDADGRATSWFVLRSSNGFHAPSADERTSPRSWYESNNLAALVFTAAAGVRTAAIYTIKASPNGVAATTHEASVSLAYDGKDGFGALSPTVAATVRPKGAGGVYTQAGLSPDWDLGTGDDAPTLSLPLALGVGWGGFYGAGSANRVYGSAGLALEQPFRMGDTRWSARAEALALIRDDRLAAMSGPRGETGTVVPLITLAVSMAY